MAKKIDYLKPLLLTGGEGSFWDDPDDPDIPEDPIDPVDPIDHTKHPSWGTAGD